MHLHIIGYMHTRNLIFQSDLQDRIRAIAAVSFRGEDCIGASDPANETDETTAADHKDPVREAR